jgi:hypothetical protein
MITCRPTNLNETDNAEDSTKFELLNGLATISCRLRTTTTRTRRRRRTMRRRRKKKEYMMIMVLALTG